jgi:ribosomal protein S18 acetylase RimI-like enzyme
VCEIVDGVPADAADLVALDQRNFVRGDRFERRLWRTLLGGSIARNPMLTRVARCDGQVVGAIAGELLASAHRMVVWSIAVDESHRGIGLAQRLMADLVERTPSTYTLVSLDARRDNARARRFYERLGFRQVKEIRAGYADGTDAIRYETSLDELRAALSPHDHAITPTTTP